MEAIIFGQHEEQTIRQFQNCLQKGNVRGGVLCADGHYGYSQPVGGVIAYEGQVSPSGVGYDIACGNKAIRTNIQYEEVKDDIPSIMDEIAQRISFGVGRKNKKRIDHAVFEDPRWEMLKTFDTQVYETLRKLAYEQLGTVGAGNHFVDIFVEKETGEIWIANHFGSRGFGHKIASGFLNIAKNEPFLSNVRGESMEQSPTLFDISSEIGTLYIGLMELAGAYAYAGRDVVLDEVLDIVKGEAIETIHNHHNYAWKEHHFGREYVVVRKGATPSAPGQKGFVGGSMGDISVIVEGKDNEQNRASWQSTVHGAGRIMSRTEAAGKMNWKTRKRMGGVISPFKMAQYMKEKGIVLRGGGTDESPFVYRPLQDVLDSHAHTIHIRHILHPVGVAMAGANEWDPYKD